MNKTIHYIWLGNRPMPKTIKKCIKSWKKYLPDWEIKEWNDSNSNIDCCRFCRENYEKGNFAFASDALRSYILYNEGGLYFDTDVELIKSINDLLFNYDGIVSFENEQYVNPGLILYFKEKHHPLAEKLYFAYKNKNINDKNTIGVTYMPILMEKGFFAGDKTQIIDNYIVTSSDFFCPYNATYSIQNFTSNTRAIHLFYGSWWKKSEKSKWKIKRIINLCIRPKNWVIVFLIKRGLLWKL